jgi:DsbC/DsbD-like thiol-disulfide interchange protein
MMLHAMISLWHATGEERFARDASLAIAHQSGAIAASPVGAINAMRALLRIYRTCPLATGMLRELLPPPQAAVQSAVGRAPDDAVQVFSHVDRVTVSTDVPAIFRVRVAIQPGYHVMSATASDGLVPFRIDVMNGKGVAAHVDYPEPTMLRMGDDTIEVYEGDMEIPVVLERAGEWSGTPIVYVRYQVCSDQACFAPTTVELDISVDRA